MRRLLLCGLAAVAAMSRSEPAVSAAWSVNSVVSGEAQHVGNPRLVPGSDDEDTLGVLDVRGSLVRETDGDRVLFSPRARLTRTVQDDALDRNEYFADMRATHDTPLGSWGADANVTRDTSLTSEWGGELFTEARKWRVRRMVYPNWTRMIGERNQARAGFGFSDVRYEDARLTPLAGYRYRWVDGDTTSALSERVTVMFKAYVSRYEASRFDNQVDDGGARIQLRCELSPTLNGSIELGGHRTHSMTATAEDWGTAGLLFARVDGIGATTSWSASLTRNVEPSGYGVLVHRDAFNATARYEIAPRWWADLDASAARDAAVQAQTSAADRKRWQVDARIGWAWTPQWVVAGGVTHVRYRFELDDREAESTTVSLRITYNSGENFF
jgi:hypothetical protein